MRIHYLQHVPFEDSSHIAIWAEENGHSVTRSLLCNGDGFPHVDDFDCLIILGGPMNTHEEDVYPWLKAEKNFIKEAIDAKKQVLGFCLGAQLIAEVLGGSVSQNHGWEIGWHPVRLTSHASSSDWAKIFPAEFMACHWHSYTFSLPEGCVHLAESEGCQNQAFAYQDHVLGMQFHVEFTWTTIERIMKNCRYQMVEQTHVQTEEEIHAGKHHLNDTKEILCKLLHYVSERI